MKYEYFFPFEKMRLKSFFFFPGTVINFVVSGSISVLSDDEEWVWLKFFLCIKAIKSNSYPTYLNESKFLFHSITRQNSVIFAIQIFCFYGKKLKAFQNCILMNNFCFSWNLGRNFAGVEFFFIDFFITYCKSKWLILL